MDIIENSILTAVLGDCMGVPYEFPSKVVSMASPKEALTSFTKRIGGRYYPTELEYQKGCYSDDTQMLLMTLRSLQYTDFVGAMVSELQAFMSYECGSGRATRASCKAWEKDRFPWHEVPDYYSFGGNGVVMRSIPHAFQNEDIHKIMTYVFLNGILTHGSPVALVSSQLYVYYAWCKVHGVLFDIKSSVPIWGNIHDSENHALIVSWHKSLPITVREEWFSVVDNLINLYSSIERKVSAILGGIPVCGSQKGAGTWCAIASILLSECKGISPMQLLRTVSTLKDADTDTLACILGGLLGIDGGIQESCFADINDINYIRYEINDFQKNRHSIAMNFVTKKNLKDKIRKLEVGQSIAFSPFGVVTLKSITELKNLSSSTRSFLYEYSTQLGQTLTALQYKKC